MKTTVLILKISLVIAALVCFAAPSEASSSGYFDTDRQEWLVDTDGDGIVDLTEEIAGTDPFDHQDFPGAEGEPGADEALLKAGGFATSSCRTGFDPAGTRLCIDTHEQNAVKYDVAQARCRSRRAHVCTYEDMFYLYYYTTMDGSYNPYNLWLGDFVHDDTVLCGNKSITGNGDADMYNFEGHCSKTIARQYYCCHDRE